MVLVDILIAIALIIASVLGLFLIKLVKRIFVTLDNIDSEIKELDSKLIPLISDFQEIADSGNKIVNYTKEQVNFANDVVTKMKNKFGGFLVNKSEKTQPQSNAHSLITNLRAIIKATTTFINELK